MMLETQQITEEEFDAREKELLDRLDQLQKRDTPLTDDEEPSEAAEASQDSETDNGEPDDEVEEEEPGETAQDERSEDDWEE